MSGLSIGHGTCGSAGRTGSGFRVPFLVLLWLTAGPVLAQVPASPSAADPQQPRNPVYIADAQVGFLDGSNNVVRADYFAPVWVSIRNSSAEIFTGTLQVLSRDRDGETVIYERPGVGINTMQTDDLQLSCFIRDAGIGLGAASGEITVRLLDKDGRLVHSLDVPLDYSIESEYLVLDISPQTVKGYIQAILADQPDLRYRGRVRTATLRPRQLPLTWQDLEAVDVIVCDQPDDAGLTVEHLGTLSHWVSQGGLLILGPGSLSFMDGTELAKAMPADVGTMMRVTPGDFRKPTAEESGEAARGRPDIGPWAYGLRTSLRFTGLRAAGTGIWPLKPRPQATVILAMPLQQGDQPVIVRRRLGLGAIVQSGISLRLLLDQATLEGMQPGVGTRIRPEMFGIRTLDYRDADVGGGMAMHMDWPNRVGPRELLVGEADFRAAGTILASVLMLLIVAYGLTATAGTWFFLRRRKLTHHSWVVFAATAVVGSVGAGFLVQSSRGIFPEVKQQAVIDLDAETGQAHVRTLYGLKVPYDTRSNVALATHNQADLPPEDEQRAYVRPAADLQTSRKDGFAVRRDYTVRYGETLVPDVPIRATVKQFESYWTGPLPLKGPTDIPGTMQASLLLEGGNAQLSSRSWITNNTGIDLRQCYLVYTNVASLNRNQREAMIQVVPIGPLPNGQTRTDLTRLIDPRDLGQYRLDKVGPKWLSSLSLVNVSQFARTARGPANAAEQTRLEAAVMMTLLSDLPTRNPNAPGGSMGFNWNSGVVQPFMHLPRIGARWLDLRHVLDGRSAILIGLAKDPGPMRLKVDGKVIEPSSGESIVRVVLPLTGTRTD